MNADFQGDLASLMAWRDGEDLPPDVSSLALARRLLAGISDVPEDLHYTLGELFEDGADAEGALASDDFKAGLETLVRSPSELASVSAAAKLFLYFDAGPIERLPDSLSNKESPGFFDVLISLAQASALGRESARLALEQALRSDRTDADEKAEIVGAISRYRQRYS